MDLPPPSNDDDGSLEGNATARRLAAAKYLLHLMRDTEDRQRAIDRLGFDPVEKAAELMSEKLWFDPDEYQGQDELANAACGREAGQCSAPTTFKRWMISEYRRVA